MGYLSSTGLCHIANKREKQPAVSFPNVSSSLVFHLENGMELFRLAPSLLLPSRTANPNTYVTPSCMRYLMQRGTHRNRQCNQLPTPTSSLHLYICIWDDDQFERFLKWTPRGGKGGMEDDFGLFSKTKNMSTLKHTTDSKALHEYPKASTSSQKTGPIRSPNEEDAETVNTNKWLDGHLLT